MHIHGEDCWLRARSGQSNHHCLRLTQAKNKYSRRADGDGKGLLSVRAPSRPLIGSMLGNCRGIHSS